MEEKKRCPYCGKEILAVAKKCKHCKQWLVDRNEIKPNIQPEQIKQEEVKTEEPDFFDFFVKYMFFVVIGLIIIIVYCMGNCTGQQSYNRDNTETIYDTDSIEEIVDDDAENNYNY